MRNNECTTKNAQQGMPNKECKTKNAQQRINNEECITRNAKRRMQNKINETSNAKQKRDIVSSLYREEESVSLVSMLKRDSLSPSPSLSLSPLYREGVCILSTQERRELDCRTAKLAGCEIVLPNCQAEWAARLPGCQTARLPDCHTATLQLFPLSRRETLSPL